MKQWGKWKRICLMNRRSVIWHHNHLLQLFRHLSPIDFRLILALAISFLSALACLWNQLMTSSWIHCLPILPGEKARNSYRLSFLLIFYRCTMSLRQAMASRKFQKKPHRESGFLLRVLAQEVERKLSEDLSLRLVTESIL